MHRLLKNLRLPMRKGVKMQIGKIYTLTRTVDLSGRQITVCRRVKLLEAGEKTVLVDNGDGTQSEMSAEAFREMAEEDRV